MPKKSITDESEDDFDDRMSSDGDDDDDDDAPAPKPKSKPKPKKKRSKSKKSKGAKRSKGVRKDRKIRKSHRTFRVVEMDGLQQKFGHYHGRTPSQAASKAATKWIGAESGRVQVGLQEITQRSTGKQYSYMVKRIRNTTKHPSVRGLKFKYRNKVISGTRKSIV